MRSISFQESRSPDENERWPFRRTGNSRILEDEFERSLQIWRIRNFRIHWRPDHIFAAQIACGRCGGRSHAPFEKTKSDALLGRSRATAEVGTRSVLIRLSRSNDRSDVARLR